MTHYLCEECGSEDGVAFAFADVGYMQAVGEIVEWRQGHHLPSVTDNDLDFIASVIERRFTQ